MPENQHIEYKQKLTPELEKEVVAFLNSREGGVIYMGIDKQGNAVGVNDVDQEQLVIKDRLKNNIAPKFELFDDRIEITSYGSLPSGLSKEEFFEGFQFPEIRS